MKNRLNRIVIFLLSIWLTSCASSTNITSRYEMAMNAYQQGRFSDAEPNLRKLVAEYPHFAEGWFRLGNLYVRTGQNEAAIASFKECLQHDPNYAKAWHNLSLSYVKMAVAVLDEGLSKASMPQSDRESIAALKSTILDVGSEAVKTKKTSDVSP